MIRLRKDHGWRLFLRTVIARAYPRVIGLQREKSWLFLDIVLPLLGLSAYVFVYRAIAAPRDFIGFVILGGAVSTFWLNVLWSMANQLYWEKETGNLTLYIMAPNSLMAILLGMAIGGIVSTTVRAAVIVLVGTWMFEVHYQVQNPAQLVGVFLLVLLALYGLGMMFASLFLLLGRGAWHLLSLAQEPVYLLSGTYFPLKSLNVWIASAASIVPLALGLDAMRQLLFASGAASGFLDVKVESAILGGLTVIFIALARWMLAYMERLAIAEGRLTEARG